MPQTLPADPGRPDLLGPAHALRELGAMLLEDVQPVGPAGLVGDLLTIQAVATVHHGESGDTLEGQFTFQASNLRGEVVGTGSGPFSAKRLSIEPLTP